MKKKTITILLAVWTIINLIVGALLIIDIQIFQAPETTIKIDIIEINSEEAIIQATIDISNPNNFGLAAKNFEVVTNTPDGYEVARILIEGGSVPPNGNKTFTATAYIAFDGSSPKLLISKITGNIGISIGPLQKTIPLAINIVTSMEDVIKDFAPPVINVQADFGELTQGGIIVTGTINAYNPNTFDIYLEEVTVNIETETGENVGNLSISGGTIRAKSSTKFNGSGMILIEALNAKMLLVNMSGVAGAKIAGFNKSMSLSVEAEIKLPDIGALLSSDSPTDLVIKADFKASAIGLINDVTLEVHNPNKIALAVNDIVVSMYRIDNDEERLISKGNLEGGIIEAETIGFFKGQLVVPYAELLIPSGGNIMPDWMKIVVRANVSIPGINQSLWLGLIGYQDFHPLK